MLSGFQTRLTCYVPPVAIQTMLLLACCMFGAWLKRGTCELVCSLVLLFSLWNSCLLLVLLPALVALWEGQGFFEFWFGGDVAWT